MSTELMAHGRQGRDDGRPLRSLQFNIAGSPQMMPWNTVTCALDDDTRGMGGQPVVPELLAS